MTARLQDRTSGASGAFLADWRPTAQVVVAVGIMAAAPPPDACHPRPTIPVRPRRPAETGAHRVGTTTLDKRKAEAGREVRLIAAAPGRTGAPTRPRAQL